MVEKVEALSSGLRHYIYRAQLVAQELARHHYVDEEKAVLGTLAYDIARSMKADQLLQEALCMNISVSPVEQRLLILLHGPVGAETLHRVNNPGR
jgi:HD superfamily phosphohydrolase YqeK